MKSVKTAMTDYDCFPLRKKIQKDKHTRLTRSQAKDELQLLTGFTPNHTAHTPELCIEINKDVRDHMLWLRTHQEQVHQMALCRIEQQKQQRDLLTRVVDKLMDINELLLLSMDQNENNPLFALLGKEENESQRNFFMEFAEKLHKLLATSISCEAQSLKPEKEIFLYAFENMMKTKGASMMIYFKQNPNIALLYLENIDSLCDLDDFFNKNKKTSSSP